MKRDHWMAVLMVLVLVAGIWYQITKRSNPEYLRHIGGLLNECRTKTGKLPHSIEECLKELDVMLMHRGDANGNRLWFFRVDDDAFLLRSYGPNGKDNKGREDDVQVMYLNGKEVPERVLVEYFSSRYEHLLPLYSQIFNVRVRDSDP